MRPVTSTNGARGAASRSVTRLVSSGTPWYSSYRTTTPTRACRAGSRCQCEDAGASKATSTATPSGGHATSDGAWRVPGVHSKGGSIETTACETYCHAVALGASAASATSSVNMPRRAASGHEATSQVSSTVAAAPPTW